MTKFAHFRAQFPACARQYNNDNLVFMDGPGGTQVPQSVIDSISAYYQNSNANSHGYFITSEETDRVLDNCRRNMADFLGAAGPECISLGQNMTTLNYSLSQAIGRYFQSGDEILITQLDHESNRGPWLALRDRGIVVKEVNLLENGQLDYEDLEGKLNARTRLLAMGYASNFMGTVNDVEYARKLTYENGTWLLLDAVHYAPHFPIDVKAMGCDFLMCSAYKFYGPHVGILYAKPGMLDRLPCDRLITAAQNAPYSIETGTLNHAALAGVSAALEFMADFGEGTNFRQKVSHAMQEIAMHERHLLEMLYEGLNQMDGISIVGPDIETLRTPTLAIRKQGKSPAEVCEYLAKHNICAWSGHFYALRAAQVLGLNEEGGVTRLGLSAYSNENDVERVLGAFQNL